MPIPINTFAQVGIPLFSIILVVDLAGSAPATFRLSGERSANNELKVNKWLLSNLVTHSLGVYFDLQGNDS